MTTRLLRWKNNRLLHGTGPAVRSSFIESAFRCTRSLMSVRYAAGMIPMAYWFSGFFARPNVQQPHVLPARACWRTITTPFNGVGVRLPELQGERPTVAVIGALADQLELSGSNAWVYLSYTCWGGKIDSVYGVARSEDGSRIGPLDEYEWEKCQETYVARMTPLWHFGARCDQLPAVLSRVLGRRITRR
jgi:hypothetical protein